MNEFRLIVAGGRDFNDYKLLSETLEYIGNVIYEAESVALVSGMARGADALGYRYAKEHRIRCYEFPANWEGLGKRAGFMRNNEMGKFANALLVFWDGKSKGTKHMIDTMNQLNKPIHLVQY